MDYRPPDFMRNTDRDEDEDGGVEIIPLGSAQNFSNN